MSKVTDDPEVIKQMQFEELLQKRGEVICNMLDKHPNLWHIQPAEMVGGEFFGPFPTEGWLFAKLGVDAGDGAYVFQIVVADGMTVTSVSALVALIEHRWAQTLMRRNGGTPEDGT